jgi:hypothetical protein
MPTSEKQLAANRANAAKSTGPRTPEGKAHSAQNARTHGFTASTFTVVRLEEFDEIARLKQDLLAVYQPVNSQELFALEQMALAQQTRLRAARLESGIFTTCLDMALNHDGTPFIPMSPDLVGGGDLSLDIEITHAQNCNYALADGFHRLARKDNTFPLFLRYKIQTERLYRRAVEEFDRLKALRPELPNEAILEAQPEENAPTYAPPDEPISTPQPNPQPVGTLGSSSSEDSARIVGQVPDLPDPIHRVQPAVRPAFGRSPLASLPVPSRRTGSRETRTDRSVRPTIFADPILGKTTAKHTCTTSRMPGDVGQPVPTTTASDKIRASARLINSARQP